MPALNPVAKVIRVAFNGLTTGGQVVANRIFLQYSGTLSSTDLATVLTTISASWNSNISPLQTNNYTLQNIVGTDLSSASAAQVINTNTHAGTSAAAPLAASTAAVIRFKIARRYRGGHPRFYLGPLPSGNLQNANAWQATYLASILSAWQAFIAACIASPPAGVGTLTHVNVHYFSGFTNFTKPSGRESSRGTPLATPTIDTISAYTVNPAPAVQRRRDRQST